MHRSPQLGDDACMVRHRLAHAGLSNPFDGVAQPIEKPYKAAMAAAAPQQLTDRSTHAP